MPRRHSAVVERLHREAPLTDVHAHPSLKAYLFGRNLWRHLWSGKAFDPLSSRADFTMLSKGGVGVLWSAAYVPERELFRQCGLLRLAASLLVPTYRKIMTGDVFDRTLETLDVMEGEINRRPDRIALARSVAEIEQIRTDGKIAVVHTLEGAHVLEGNPDRLDVLAERGVAMITLSHFFYNELCTQVDGIPPEMSVRKLCKFTFGGEGAEPLSEVGRAIVRKMVDLRMIVDVAHCTPSARAEVFREVARRSPIVASHVGVAALKPDPYNLDRDEILEIAASGGAVGVIFMNYWLSEPERKSGLPIIWQTMQHIHDVTGSWDHVMLGTDFDGFTAPPDDVRDASQLGRVTQMLLAKGLPEQDIKKVLGGNALRVLATGWREERS